MDQAEFEAQLDSDGYTHIETKALDPRPSNTEHAHDYAIRGLVLDGIFIVRQWPTRYLSCGGRPLRCPLAKSIQKRSVQMELAFS